MEVNKYEAERCIELAEKYIREDNREKAERFLHMAERLYPTERANELLLCIQLMPLTIVTNEFKQPRNAKTEYAPSRPAYTAEQAKAVKRIQQCKDYYGILLVSKDATYAEIKRSYKKLALLLHHDRNSHPGAAEAFKKIRNAVAELTNAEKRKQYDQKEVDKVGPSSSHSSTGHAYSGGFQADATTREPERPIYHGGLPQTGRSFPGPSVPRFTTDTIWLNVNGTLVQYMPIHGTSFTVMENP